MISLLKRFRADRSGNFGILIAIVSVPLLAAVGLALDYGEASRVRSLLFSAADGAALGAIAEGSPAIIAAAAMNSDGDVPVGEEDAVELFDTYLIAETGLEITSLSADVAKNGSILGSEVEFTAKVPLRFMSIFGNGFTTVSGKASAQMGMAPFMDFYMLLDNSPSMGVGATPSDISTLIENTPDRCAFACHDLSNGDNYYHLAKDLGVTMRIDVVRQATQRLTQTAKEARKYAGQFRMGVYSFGEAATDLRLLEVAEPDTDLDRVRDAAATIDLMTIPHQNYDNDQQTGFDAMFDALDDEIGTPGAGNSPTDRQKIVFFVSDGVGDSYKPTACTKRTTGGRCQEPIDVRACAALKDRGIRIAVLYTTYLPIPENAWYATWIEPFEDEIGARMEECASPGLYFEVSPTEGIADAMKALFLKVVNNPRLTG